MLVMVAVIRDFFGKASLYLVIWNIYVFIENDDVDLGHGHHYEIKLDLLTHDKQQLMPRRRHMLYRQHEVTASNLRNSMDVCGRSNMWYYYYKLQSKVALRHYVDYFFALLCLVAWH